MQKADCCLFAIGARVFVWHPGMEKAKLLLVREEAVTSFAQGFHEKKWRIWETDVAGKVRVDFGSEPIFSFDSPVSALVANCLNPTMMKGSGLCLDHLLFIATDPNLVAFYNSEGNELANHVTGFFGNNVTMAVQSEGEIFWSRPNGIMRGFGKGKTEVAVIDDHPIIVPVSGNFYVCHYQNELTHPEGVILSTRDRRTILSFDPDQFGYVLTAGIFEQSVEDEDKMCLLFTTVSIKKNLLRAFWRPLRQPAGEPALMPKCILELQINEELRSKIVHHHRGSNPFTVINLEVINYKNQQDPTFALKSEMLE